MFISKSLHIYFRLSQNAFTMLLLNAEAVAQRCSVKKVLLEISQNSYEKVSFLISDTRLKVIN